MTSEEAARLMEALKKAMVAVVERYACYREFSGYVQDVMGALESEMLKSGEATTRLFLAECSLAEFEYAAWGFLELARKHGLPFVEHLEQLANEKGWTDYLEDMISEARAEVE